MLIRRAKIDLFLEELLKEELYKYVEIDFATYTTNIYSLATLLGTPCLYRVGPHVAFRTALILCGIDSSRC